MPAPGPSAAIPAEHGASVSELAGIAAAATTFITALAFFFGWTFTNARSLYFGIDPSTLGFSTRDYVLRSVDALFVPIGAVFCSGLAAVGICSLVARVRVRGRHARLIDRAARAGVIAGGLLVALAVSAALGPVEFPELSLVPSLSLGVGVALSAYGAHLLRRRSAPRRPPVAATLAVLLVLLSAFWTASVYAKKLGRGRAEDLAGELGRQPWVVVFAPRRLGLTGPGVREWALHMPDSAYRYRYSGLRLLIRSGGSYFLLPERWSRAGGAAIVLRDTPELRFEFGVGSR